MKRSRSYHEALSPRSSENHTQDHFPEQHRASDSPDDIYNECFGDALISAGDLDPLQQYISSYSGHLEETNKLNRSEVSNTNTGTLRSRQQEQKILERAQQSAAYPDDGFLRGATNYTEQPGHISIHRKPDNTQRCLPGATVASSYNTRHRSYSVASQRSSVTPMPNLPTALAISSEVRSTQFAPYRGLFLTSEKAREHRHFSTRFGRQPYINPEDDSTIAEVEEHRQYHVGRIYDAMTRGDRALDNANSIAMKRWVNGAHYKSDLVEAFAHKVFDCLLVQVKEGFRGWHHNDYVDDDRKGEKEDREADCKGRLDNIIDALEREKTICEDVVNSASQVRIFVNAPIAYASRKYQNRVGNSKRGRTKDSTDLSPRPTKTRRMGERHTRARSATVSEVPTSRDTTPRFQAADCTTPYYLTPVSKQVAPSPKHNYKAPIQSFHSSEISLSQVPSERRHPNNTTRPAMSSTAMSGSTMSPPINPSSRSYNAHVTTITPAHVSSLTSTSSHSYSYRSTPSSSDDAKYPISTISSDTWPSENTFDNSLCTPLDPLLATNDIFFSQQILSNSTTVEAGSAASYFEQNPNINHVCLAELEQSPSRTTGASNNGQTDFESYWNDQPGVQPFSFDGHQ